MTNFSKYIPKTIFKQMPLDLESEMLLGFLEEDWSDVITKKYPQFAKIKTIEIEKERRIAIKNEINSIRTKLGNQMDDGLLLVKNNWQKVEEITLKTLAEIIQTNYLKKDITAFISINPVCPRFLDDWSFSVPIDHKNSNKTVAHEVSHFLFFKKLKEEFPEIERYKYESPHEVWIFSEILAVIILCDKRMLKALNIPKFYGYYPKHKKLKINGEFLTKLIEDIYLKHVVEEKDFTKFIKESLELFKNK